MKRLIIHPLPSLVTVVLLISPLVTHVGAQPDNYGVIPKKVPAGITVNKIGDPRYGVGGEHVVYSDEKRRVTYEYWTDASGKVMETHTVNIQNGKPFKEYWSFRHRNEAITATAYWYDHDKKEFTDNRVTRINRADEATMREWIDRIERNFAETGKLSANYQVKPPPPKEEQPKQPTKTPSLTSGIDPCVVGKWVATAVEDLGTYKFEGGTGFTVTIGADGTQTIDYTNMQPFKKLSESFRYEGIAVGKVKALSGQATIESIERADVSQIATLVVVGTGTFPLKNMGPGALGSTANDNDYVCTESNLTYKASWLLNGKPTYQIVLTRRK